MDRLKVINSDINKLWKLIKKWVPEIEAGRGTDFAWEQIIHEVDALHKGPDKISEDSYPLLLAVVDMLNDIQKREEKKAC